MRQFVLGLAQGVYRARGAGGRVPLDVGEALAQLEQAPPPLGSIAPFLRAVGSGQPVPPVPPGLPEELAPILQALVRAVEEEGASPSPQPSPWEGEGEGISLEELLALVVAGCRGETQAGQRAYTIVRALQQPGGPPENAALGKALQRLLEGLRGAAVLEGLPADLATIVEKVEQQLQA